MDVGQTLTLRIEKPVAGGRMLARHDGRVVLVSGAIPEELVVVRVERVQSQVALASTIDVVEPHPARRADNPDPACGGMTYAHVTCEHQRRLKAEVIADAFVRLARLTLETLPSVAASPERGYRMRTRLHLRGGRLGSFREGTHEICDIALTGQLLDRTLTVLAEVAETLRRHGIDDLEAIEVTENLEASERVLHVDEGTRGSRMGRTLLDRVGAVPGVTGVSHSRAGRTYAVARVADRLEAFTGRRGELGEATVAREARAFFQANRFLTPTLVQAVMGALGASPVVDLYAGVGLFAMAAAASGASDVVAVEGDEVSSVDLVANLAQLRGRVAAVGSSVEDFFTMRAPRAIGTLIVDPPRTGISKVAMAGVVAARAPRVVYVSCDVATLARDARRLLDAGYAIEGVEAFDLFPNTPHVESLVTFVRVV